MELRQLQHFVAVAEERHFTRAAQRVHIVQSALSASIRALEEELQVKLLTRSTRQVRLTGAGAAFLDKARIALAAIHDARETVSGLRSLERGSLSIGTVQSLPAFLDLPLLLADFHAQYPGIEVRLAQASSDQLLARVRKAELDLAFLPLEGASDGVTTELIACEALVMVCAPGHALAGRERIELTALHEHAFVDFQPGWGTRSLIDRAFAEAQITRRTAFEVSDLNTALELVGHGLGVALMPEAIAESRQPSLAVVPLAGPEICWELVVAYRSPEQGNAGGDAAAKLLDLLQSTTQRAEAG